jgi:hypothetical protein
MSSRERSELALLVRRREKLAKADVDSLAAAREADFEAQLAKTYDRYAEAWREQYERAERAVEDLNETIWAEFEEAGVPPEFSPSARMSWSSRGENAIADRRAELRKVARTRIVAEAKAAKAAVERASVEAQTRLCAAGLESEEARRFLDGMPTAEALMPAVPSVAEIEAAAAGGRTSRRFS